MNQKILRLFIVFSVAWSGLWVWSARTYSYISFDYYYVRGDLYIAVVPISICALIVIWNWINKEATN